MALWIGITIFVIADLALAVFIVWFLNKKVIGGYTAPYPPVEPAPGAHREDFQSVSIGLGNFGKSMHITIDESYLHLMPAKMLRWFGIQPMSVPWDDITNVRVDKRERWATARLAKSKTSMKVPAWCLAPIREPAA